MPNLEKKYTIRGAVTAFHIARNTLRKRLRATNQVADERGLYSEEQIKTAIESGAQAYQQRCVSVSSAKLREIKARTLNVELKNTRLLTEIVTRSEIESELEKAFEHVSKTLADSALSLPAKKELRENIVGWRERFQSIAQSPIHNPSDLDDEEEDENESDRSELQREQDRESAARALQWELKNDLETGVRLMRNDVFAALELILVTVAQIVNISALDIAEKERLLNVISDWPATDLVVTKLLFLCKPKELLLPSQWSERYRLAPAGSVKAGKWVCFPFQIQPMDSIADPTVSSLTLMMASQLIGKSSIIESQLAWMIDQAPCPTLVVFPTLSNAIHWSKNRFSPLIDSTERLSKLVDEAKPKRRGSGEATIVHKRFPGGGWLLAQGSGSAANLRSHTCRLAVFDEVDGFKDSAGDEGDIISLVEQRSIRYSDSFSIKTSTPSARNFSRIEKEYDASDRRAWYVRCPRCDGQPFIILWHMIKWEKSKSQDGKTTRHNTRTAWLECPACQAKLSESERVSMVEQGQWIPRNPEVVGRRGYWLNGLAVLGPPKRGYGSWLSWFADQFLIKKKLGVAGMRPWQNLILGESFELEGAEPPGHEILLSRREAYAEDEDGIILPEKVLMIVAGVDIQMDRIEMSIVGYGEHDETWSLQYVVLPGNPEMQSVWTQVYAWITKGWRHPSGHTLNPFQVCIDAGYLDYIVARFCKNSCRRLLTVSSTVGKRGFERQWWRKSKTDPLLTILKVDYAKEMLYRRLKITTPGPEFCHFPSNANSGYDATYFEGLTIEKMMTDKPQPYFIKRHETDRNEPLDIFVLCMAAKELAQPDWKSAKKWLESKPDHDWRKPEETRRDLLTLPIPDLRGVEVGMEALRNKIRDEAKHWCKIT